MGELIIIMLVGLIIVGPEKLPDLARSAGRTLASFQQTFEGIQRDIDQGMKEAKDAAEVKMPTHSSEPKRSGRDPDHNEEEAEGGGGEQAPARKQQLEESPEEEG